MRDFFFCLVLVVVIVVVVDVRFSLLIPPLELNNFMLSFVDVILCVYQREKREGEREVRLFFLWYSLSMPKACVSPAFNGGPNYSPDMVMVLIITVVIP